MIQATTAMRGGGLCADREVMPRTFRELLESPHLRVPVQAKRLEYRQRAPGMTRRPDISS